MGKKTRDEVLVSLATIDNMIITSEVIDFILNLESSAADKVIRSLQNLSKFGFYLPKKDYHRLWASKYKLWELITKHSSNQYRSLFFSVSGGKYLITNAIIKKTDKVPQKDIAKADSVYEEWIEEKGGK